MDIFTVPQSSMFSKSPLDTDQLYYIMVLLKKKKYCDEKNEFIL